MGDYIFFYIYTFLSFRGLKLRGQTLPFSHIIRSGSLVRNICIYYRLLTSLFQR